MFIEISGYSISNGTVSIYGYDISENHLEWLERNRYDDRFERELEFVFDTKNQRVQATLYRWLKQQKASAGATTWKDAFRSVIGTRTELSGRFLNRDRD